MPGASVSRSLLRIEGDRRRTSFDRLATEEPLEIRVGGRPMAVTMRTPGHDFELAAGFLLTEGVVDAADELRSMRYCLGPDERGAGFAERQEFNVVDVVVADSARAEAVAPRAIFTSSSCGLCGRASISSVRSQAPLDVADDPIRLSVEMLAAMPGRLRESQKVFASTGGLHAAGLFDGDGNPVCVREDVGRHNAFDKVIGWAGHARSPSPAFPCAGGVGAGQFRAGAEGPHCRCPRAGGGVGLPAWPWNWPRRWG